MEECRLSIFENRAPGSDGLISRKMSVKISLINYTLPYRLLGLENQGQHWWGLNMTEMRNGQKILAGKHEGRYRCRWCIVLRWILKDTGDEYVDWISLNYDRVMWQALVNTVMSVWFLWNV
jgi:hypothetical protein